MNEQSLILKLHEALKSQCRPQEEIDEINKAYLFAKKLHEGQYRVSEEPYIIHPCEVALILTDLRVDKHTIIAAFLHDVIEDHSDKYSFEYLKSQGFNKEIIDVLKLLTHSKDIEYMDYIQKIKTNPYATKVKIADLKHNLDNRRTEGVKSPKYELYKQALELLVEENKK